MKKIYYLELQTDTLSDSQIIEFQLLKVKVLSKQGRFNEAYELLEKLKRSEKKFSSSQKIDYLLLNSQVIWSLGNYSQSKILLKKAQKEISRSNIEEAEKKKIEILIQQGQINWSLGDLETALELFQRSLESAKAIGHIEFIAESMGNISAILMLQGFLKKALATANETLKIFRETGNKVGVAEISNNIGYILWRQGELNKALEHFETALSIFERIGDRGRLATAQANIGKIYYQKNEFLKALDRLEEAKNLYQKLNQSRYLSTCLFYLIIVSHGAKRYDDANKYLASLENLAKQLDYNLAQQQSKLAKALLLKDTKRFQTIAKAEQLLREITKEEVIDSYVSTLAFVNLGEILLFELRSTGGDPVVVQEIQEIVNRLLEIANKENLFILLVQVYLVQSKLALLQLNQNFARKLLTRAQEIAEEKGLDKLAILVSNEFDQFLTTTEKFDEYRESNVIKRVKILELDEALLNLTHIPTETRIVKEEIPVLLLIMHENGLCVYSREFDHHQFREQLISGVLTAVNSLMRDAFALTGSIERIKYKEYILVFKEVSPLLFCYAFKGSSYYPLHKLERFIQILQEHEEHWNILCNVPDNGVLPTPEEQKIIENHLRTIFLSNA
ncbi:MAG: tetratricopeptide repeat protein [Candidatus Hodarchaeales archaeon]